MDNYGAELILDMHGCIVQNFNRYTIEKFCEEVCNETGMQKCELYWFDDFDTPAGEEQTDPQTTGTSAVQFILTSNITVHTLDKLGKVFINFFSCKLFEPYVVRNLALARFGGKIVNEILLTRI